MSRITLTDAQVATLRSYDLFTLRQGAADYHKKCAEQGGADQTSPAWPLWVVTQNLMSVIDALPCQQIEPQADWPKV
jgi:hypothetical protein